MTEERNLPVPMRDGVVLRADVYRPVAKGTYPVSLLHTLYDKLCPGTVADVRALAARGYIVANQDIRGRHDSVEWAAALPGSDGRVGTYGNSYMGLHQLDDHNHPAPSLKAMYSSGMSAAMHQMTFGVFDMGRGQQWMHSHAADSRRRAGEPGAVTREAGDHNLEKVERQKWLWYVPQDEFPYRVFSTLTTQAKQHYREQHLNVWNFSKAHSRVQVPTCQSTGWYDRLSGTIANFEGMVANGPAATRDQHRKIGAYPGDPRFRSSPPSLWMLRQTGARSTSATASLAPVTA